MPESAPNCKQSIRWEWKPYNDCHSFNHGGQRFGNNRFGQFSKRNVNEIEDMEEGLDEGQFDVFDPPLKDTQETISEKQKMNTVALDLPEIHSSQSPFVETRQI